MMGTGVVCFIQDQAQQTRLVRVVEDLLMFPPLAPIALNITSASHSSIVHILSAK